MKKVIGKAYFTTESESTRIWGTLWRNEDKDTIMIGMYFYISRWLFNKQLKTINKLLEDIPQLKHKTVTGNWGTKERIGMYVPIEQINDIDGVLGKMKDYLTDDLHFQIDDGMKYVYNCNILNKLR